MLKVCKTWQREKLIIELNDLSSVCLLWHNSLSKVSSARGNKMARIFCLNSVCSAKCFHSALYRQFARPWALNMWSRSPKMKTSQSSHVDPSCSAAISHSPLKNFMLEPTLNSLLFSWHGCFLEPLSQYFMKLPIEKVIKNMKNS